jgi:osmotically inducible protein OsmC
MVTRDATTQWVGDLRTGRGTVHLDSSNAGEFPVSFPTRSGAPDGQTSPEELVAAAHSACYAMSLAHLLARSGAPATALAVSAEVTLGRDDVGLVLTRVDLTVAATVPGAADEHFQQLADAAKQSCPISRALAAVPDITVTATLDG